MSHQTFAILLIFYKISFLCCVHCVTPGGHHDVNNLQIVNNVLNANFECPSNATAASISAAKSAKPVFEVADCDASQSRWDYNFQSSVGGSKFDKFFNGDAALTFAVVKNSQKFKFGLKHKKCVLLHIRNVTQIKGVFHNDNITGKIQITFQNGSYLIGQADKNFLVGVQRLFDKNNILQSVAEGDLVLHERDVSDLFVIPFKDQKIVWHPESRLLMSCLQFDGIVFTNCTNQHEDILIADEECKFQINEKYINNLDCGVKSKKDTFSFQVKTKQKSILAQNINCNHQNWSNVNIRKEILEWKSALMRNPDPFWFQEDNFSPFDLDNLELDISIPSFVNREVYNNQKVQIKSHRKTLFTGLIINGTIKGQIDRATSQLPDWKYPVQIWIDQAKMELGFGILNPAVVIARLKSGKLHGPAVMHGLLSYDPNCHFCSKLIYPGLGFFGRFIDGKASGICWKELRGGGWIYGEMDSEGTWTGDNIAYIYPDLKTAIVGQYKNGILISGQEAEVVSVRCAEIGFPELQFSKPSGPMFHFEPPTETTFGDQPLVDDPLDKRYMHRKQSLAFEEAGESTFASEDIPKGLIFGLYGGYVWSVAKYERWYLDSIAAGISLDELKHEVMYLNGVSSCDMKIHIPPEFGPEEKLRNTMARKINHSFKPDAEFDEIDTPRLGMISCLRSLRPIAKGEEIFAFYHYTFRKAPLWFKKNFLDYLENNPAEDEDTELTKIVRDGMDLEQLKAEYRQHLQQSKQK